MGHDSDHNNNQDKKCLVGHLTFSEKKQIADYLQAPFASLQVWKSIN